jgi:sec-independent protein translocase protein TatA
MKGMKDDDVRTRDTARTSPVRGEVLPPATAADREREALEAEARAAEARAAELRARATQAGPADSTR